MVDTGSPRADAPSTVTAVASDTQNARPAFSLVMPLPTMWTRRRPNSSVPVAMARPPPASTSTGTTPIAADIPCPRRTTDNGPAMLPTSLAPWAKPRIITDMTSAGRSSGLIPGLRGCSASSRSTLRRVSHSAPAPVTAAAAQAANGPSSSSTTT